MYVIQIKINNYDEQKMENHREWFMKYFKKGIFLILGPSKTFKNSGVIITKADNIDIKSILSEDPFYPNDAEYQINEFDPKAISSDISK